MPSDDQQRDYLYDLIVCKVLESIKEKEEEYE